MEISACSEEWYDDTGWQEDDWDEDDDEWYDDNAWFGEDFGDFCMQ